ncbi:Myb-binding protein 1A-like protein, partial [Trichoplax sp. H2]
LKNCTSPAPVEVTTSCISFNEFKMAKKVRLNSDAQNDILPYFWTLASVDEDERLLSAENILTVVLRLQKEYSEQKQPNMQLDKRLCNELQYTVQRLVKGLGSFRKAARLGFSTLLAEVLKQFREVSIESVLHLSSEHLIVTHSAKSEEKRNNYIGQVFVNLCIISSGRLYHMEADANDLVLVTKNLFQLSKEKNYIREIAITGIVDIIKKVPFKLFVRHIAPILQTDLQKGWNETTPEALMVVLCIEKAYKNKPYQKLLSKDWGDTPVFDTKNYAKMADILKVNVVLSKEFLRTFINSLSSTKAYLYDAAKHLATFLENFAEKDDSLLSFHIVKQLISNQGHINFDSITHTKTVQSIVAKMQSKSLSAYLSMIKSVFNFGYETIFQATEKCGLEQSRIWVANQMLALMKSYKLSTTDESWVVDVLKFLLFHSFFTTTNDIDDSIKAVEISEVVRKILCERLQSALAELSNRCSDSTSSVTNKRAPKQLPMAGRMSNGFYWGYEILLLTRELYQQECKLIESVEHSNSINDIVNDLISIIKRIHEKSIKDNKPESIAFEVLFSHLGLTIFENTENSIELIKELQVCYNKLSAKKQANSKKKEPLWIEVLTEILLSLMTYPSSMLRSLCNSVFQLICNHLTSDGLKSITDIIDPKNEMGQESSVEVVSGFQDDDEAESLDEELSNKEESNDEEESSEEETETIDEGFRQEVRTALGDAADDMEGNNKDDSFNTTVYDCCLCMTNVISLLVQDDSDASLSDYDDETMLKLDDALSAAFKKRLELASHGKAKKETKRTIMYYKLRVLDLIEVFIKQCPSSPLIVDLVLPLLSITTTSKSKDNKEFIERTGSILKNKLCKIQDYCRGDKMNVDHAVEIFNEVTDKLLKSSSQATFATNSIIYFFLIRVLRGINPEIGLSPLKTRRQSQAKKNQSNANKEYMIPHIESSFRLILKDFMTSKKTKVTTTFCTEMIRRYPEISFGLTEDFLYHLQNSINSFRKAQASILISAIITAIQPYDLLKKSFNDYCNKIEALFTSMLNEIVEMKSELKKKHLKDFLKLVLKYANYVRNNAEACRSCDLNDIKIILEKLVSSSEFANSKGVCKNILSTIARNPQQVSSRKRKKTTTDALSNNS